MYVSQNLHGAWTVEMARPCLDVGQAQERVRCMAIGCGVRQWQKARRIKERVRGPTGGRLARRNRDGGGWCSADDCVRIVKKE